MSALRCCKFSERWIQIRIGIFARRGNPVVMRYPSIDQFAAICRMFLAASDMFDRIPHGGRHNMTNYNMCWHQITHHLGIRHEIESHFYWPLLKTPKVLQRLLGTWIKIADKFGWKYADMDEMRAKLP